MPRCNLQRVPVASPSATTHNWSALSFLCIQINPRKFGLAAADGSDASHELRCGEDYNPNDHFCDSQPCTTIKIDAENSTVY